MGQVWTMFATYSFVPKIQDYHKTTIFLMFLISIVENNLFLTK
jgi:hypothetical protein